MFTSLSDLLNTPLNLPSCTKAQTEVVADFLRCCSPDPATRTMAATMFALTHWQLAGQAMTSMLPSMILVNAGGAEIDPLDAFADKYATRPSSKKPPKTGTGTFLGGKPENARNAMLRSIIEAKKLGRPTPDNAQQFSQYEKRFLDAKMTGYGCGSTSRYSRAWDDELGWITDPSNELILRLDQPEDREAFRRDVLEDSEKLLNPYGVGECLRRGSKTIAISGSLAPEDWDDALVRRLMLMGLPMFFLPHFGRDPLKVNTPFLMHTFSDSISCPMHIRYMPVRPAIRIAGGAWAKQFEKALRRRLCHLPGPYEFSVLKTVHELGDVCSNIARHSFILDAKPNEISDMCTVDLHCMAFRGIVIGVASLAYHCLGFYPGCPRADAVKMLQIIRGKGQLSRRDLQRKFSKFNAADIDKVLECLAAEGLVELDGRNVAAVPLADFIQSLYARPEFHEPELLLQGAAVEGSSLYEAAQRLLV